MNYTEKQKVSWEVNNWLNYYDSLVCKVAIPTVQVCYKLKHFNNTLVGMEMNQPLVVNHYNPFVDGK